MCVTDLFDDSSEKWVDISMTRCLSFHNMIRSISARRYHVKILAHKVCIQSHNLEEKKGNSISATYLVYGMRLPQGVQWKNESTVEIKLHSKITCTAKRLFRNTIILPKENLIKKNFLTKPLTDEFYVGLCQTLQHQSHMFCQILVTTYYQVIQ